MGRRPGARVSAADRSARRPREDPVVAGRQLGDDEFRGYFVVQTPEMLIRYGRSVAPAIPMADDAAIERMSDSVSGRCGRSGMVAAAHSRGRAWTRGGAGSVYAASTREHGFGESSLSHPE
jgi:hypothetical protein